MDLSGEGTEADMTIAVMGMTGVGKSTFIRHCLDASSAAQPIIGHDIESCTQDVEVYQCQYGMDRQYTVDLVDTPGFDDTHRSDREVLEAISLWLTTSGRYQSNRKLHGIIYLHRISDVRMQGSALNNLRMFKKLCGPEAFHRILLTTTMWEQVLPEDGSRRLSQLETADDFWAPMIRKGSRVVQHLNTPDSAKKLIGLFLDKPNAAGQSQLPTSIILDIQTELLKKDATLMQTGAGRELDGNLAAAQIKVETEVETIKADIRDAEAECDDDDAEYLRKQIPTLMRKIEELQADREGLHVSFKEVMELERRRQDKASEMQKNLQEERSRTAELRRNTEDLRLKHEGEMARLRKQLQGTQIDRTQTTEVASPNLATWTRQIKLQNLHTTSFKVFGDAFFFQASNSCIWSYPFRTIGEKTRRLTSASNSAVLGFGPGFLYDGDQFLLESSDKTPHIFNLHVRSDYERWSDPTDLGIEFLRQKYPDIANYPKFNPSFISFGEDGLFFASGMGRLAANTCHKLPETFYNRHNTEKWQTNTNTYDPNAVHPRVWLGAKSSWICQISRGSRWSNTEFDTSYDLCGCYPGLQKLLDEKVTISRAHYMDRSNQRDTSYFYIYDVALNITDQSSWFIVFDDGNTGKTICHSNAGRRGQPAQGTPYAEFEAFFSKIQKSLGVSDQKPWESVQY